MGLETDKSVYIMRRGDPVGRPHFVARHDSTGHRGLVAISTMVDNGNRASHRHRPYT
jgi:hypothetical protein